MAEILGEYTIRRILWSGYRRPGVATWERTYEVIAEEVRTEGASVRSMNTHPRSPREAIRLGDSTITHLAGWGRWEDGAGLSERTVGRGTGSGGR